MARLSYRLLPWVSVLALAAAWQGLAASGAVTPFMLPRPAAVAERIWTDLVSGELLQSLALTLYRALSGFAIAAIAGIGLGVMMARSRVMLWFFDPVISVGFPMPMIAFLPIITLWLGFHDVSKISMVVFDAVFPVITATIAATAGVERQLLWSARNLGARPGELLREVVFPAALPQIMTGLQVALPLSLIVAVVAEMLMGGYGLGGAMMTASRFANSTGVFAGIVEIAVVGYVLVKAMSMLRRRLLIWHQEANEPTTA